MPLSTCSRAIVWALVLAGASSSAASADGGGSIAHGAFCDHPHHFSEPLAGAPLFSSTPAQQLRRVRRVQSSHIPAETTVQPVVSVVPVIHLTGQGGGGVMRPPPRRHTAAKGSR